jgi:hypothetical protein
MPYPLAAFLTAKLLIFGTLSWDQASGKPNALDWISMINARGSVGRACLIPHTRVLMPNVAGEISYPKAAHPTSPDGLPKADHGSNRIPTARTM